jgi:putative endonuclease
MHYGGHVYIVCNNNRNVLYTGVTSALRKRIHQHKNKYYPDSFTARYHCATLVYYCFYKRIEMAIAEEKRIKGGSRQQKIDLINSINPLWEDLWATIQYWY